MIISERQKNVLVYFPTDGTRRKERINLLRIPAKPNIDLCIRDISRRLSIRITTNEK